MENWKPIENKYNCLYEVSDLGRVRNSETGTILSQNLNKRLNYMVVSLRRGKNKIRISVSNLVANAFVPNTNNDLYVGYKDGNKTNVVSSNLYWYSSTLVEIDKGVVFGSFVVLADLGMINKQHRLRVKCSCGNISDEVYTVLNKGVKTNCGCIKRPLPEIIPLDIEEVNKRDLGTWTVVEELSFWRNDKGLIKREVRMRCKCGYEKITKDITRSKSCASCVDRKGSKYTKEELRNRTLLFARFGAMRQRCYNPEDKCYITYGAKDITICDEWLEKPKRFVNWALENGFERHLELDRIENDKGYSPDNCQFITKEENSLKNSIINLTPEDVHWIRSDDFDLEVALNKFTASEYTIMNIRNNKTFTSI